MVMGILIFLLVIILERLNISSTRDKGIFKVVEWSIGMVL
jgi:hypothetical protein